MRAFGIWTEPQYLVFCVGITVEKQGTILEGARSCSVFARWSCVGTSTTQPQCHSLGKEENGRKGPNCPTNLYPTAIPPSLFQNLRFVWPHYSQSQEMSRDWPRPGFGSGSPLPWTPLPTASLAATVGTGPTSEQWDTSDVDLGLQGNISFTHRE